MGSGKMPVVKKHRPDTELQHRDEWLSDLKQIFLNWI